MHISTLLFMGLVPVSQCFPRLGHLDHVNSYPCPPVVSTNTGSLLKPNHFKWEAPGPNDIRSPCPIMNTLANHGFVNRNGRNMTRDVVVKGINEGLGIEIPEANNIFDNALVVNPIPNATFFDFEMMHTHNIIEHDGSLSRRDAVFDLTNSFDEGTFENFVSYFGTDKTINISSIANARARHALDMSHVNPSFNITEAQIPVIVGENAMLLVLFGRPSSNPLANRAYLEYFFRNQRLPVALGWTPVETPVDPYLGQLVEDIIAQSPAGVPLTFAP